MTHDVSTAEFFARRIAGEALADVRTVRRELANPGSVRGLVGARIRWVLTRYRNIVSAAPAAAA